jgi:hypothetical protein
VSSPALRRKHVAHGNEELAMLNPVGLTAVLASTNLARSQAFYERTVQLPLSSETVPNHLLFDTGAGTLLIYGRPAANKLITPRSGSGPRTSIVTSTTSPNAA